MLILARKENEQIRITTPDGTQIDVMVVDIRNAHNVRIGVNAPKEVEVHRMEVWKAIQHSKQSNPLESHEPQKTGA